MDTVFAVCQQVFPLFWNILRSYLQKRIKCNTMEICYEVLKLIENHNSILSSFPNMLLFQFWILQNLDMSNTGKVFKGTLMQIWKSPYMLVFIWNQYPENITFLILRIYPWSL